MGEQQAGEWVGAGDLECWGGMFGFKCQGRRRSCFLITISNLLSHCLSYEDLEVDVLSSSILS